MTTGDHGTHVRCEEEGCHKQPVFGPKGGRAVFCRQHALAHHVDVSNRRCQVAGCEARALYGEANGSKALRCTQVCLSGVWCLFFLFFSLFFCLFLYGGRHVAPRPSDAHRRSSLLSLARSLRDMHAAGIMRVRDGVHASDVRSRAQASPALL